MTDIIPTETQVSAGGVAFRSVGQQIQVALISVGDQRRWQLPKGMVSSGESHEQAAVREVREETGLVTELLQPIDKVEYWFYAHHEQRRVRIHKYVHFFLLRYLSGDVSDHDHEVNEARWVEIDRAVEMLAFESDRKIVEIAREQILQMGEQSV